MPILNPNYRKLDQQLATDVPSVEEKLRPDVIRIRYASGEDWSGDPAIFFRVTLPDSAIQRNDLGEFTNKISDQIVDQLGLDIQEYWPYFNFRTESEQERLKDPGWD